MAKAEMEMMAKAEVEAMAKVEVEELSVFLWLPWAEAPAKTMKTKVEEEPF